MYFIGDGNDELNARCGIVTGIRSSGPIVWIVRCWSTYGLLLTWTIICCVFQGRQSRQSIYMHRRWISKKYSIPTGIGALGAFAWHCLEQFGKPERGSLHKCNGRYMTRTWKKICNVQYNCQIHKWTWRYQQTSAIVG
jgi:hypothetical protein